MLREIVTGETGSGKTYETVMNEIKANRRFAYISPCRQLVYETYMSYGNSKVDCLSTGELKINNNNHHNNFYGVYESFLPEMVKMYETLIVDEAHFIHDESRGPHIINILAAAIAADINIKLVTATCDFAVAGFKKTVIRSKFKTPKNVEIDFDQAIKNIIDGMQTIWFCNTIKEAESIAKQWQDADIKAVAIHSGISPSERLKSQIDFKNKNVQVVACTNVLAQGLNFECENLIIEEDDYETNNQLHQKIGRLGRPNTLTDKSEVYYCTVFKPNKINVNYRIRKIPSSLSVDTINYASEDQLNSAINEIENGGIIRYSDIKYCIAEFKEYATRTIEEEPFRFESESRVAEINAALNSILTKLVKISKLNKNNVNINRGCYHSSILTLLSWFNKPDMLDELIDTINSRIIYLSPVELHSIDEVLYKTISTLTSGNSNDSLADILKNENHKDTLKLLNIIDSEKGKEIISGWISNIKNKIKYSHSAKYLNYVMNLMSSDSDLTTSHNELISSLKEVLDMIEKEQEALSDLIINNMSN